jgi:hypothetical protein
MKRHSFNLLDGDCLLPGQAHILRIQILEHSLKGVTLFFCRLFVQIKSAEQSFLLRIDEISHQDDIHTVQVAPIDVSEVCRITGAVLRTPIRLARARVARALTLPKPDSFDYKIVAGLDFSGLLTGQAAKCCDHYKSAEEG